MVTETIIAVEEIDTTSADWVNTEYRTDKKGILFCITAGTVDLIMNNGIAVSKSMVAGEYWRISPATVKTTSTAVVQLHW